ncbi:MAG: hypothetical protein Kow006_17850 [Gammaproteobacteria bacterium]
MTRSTAERDDTPAMSRGPVLVIEPEATTRRLLSEMLARGGYESHLAADSPSARACCQGHAPAVALCSLPPTTDALDLVAWMTTERRLFVVGIAEDGDAATRYAQAGACTVIPKPPPEFLLLASVGIAHRLLGEKLRHEERQRGRRRIGTAVGIVMERQRLGEKEAYQLLRRIARSERRRMVEVAEEIIAASAGLNLADPR